MARVIKFLKDKKVRKNFLKKELKILLFKYNVLNAKNDREKKYFLYHFAQKFHLNWSRSRIINKCIFSGRTRWVISRFKLSRMMFKNLCDNGNIHGIRRSSW